MEMPIPVGKATLRALDNIVAAKRVLQGDVPSRRCTRSGLPGPTLLPRGTRKVGVVAGEERLERGLRRLVGRRRRELEHRNGVGLGVVGAAVELVEATLLVPDLAVGVEARVLAVVPRLDPGVRGIAADAAVDQGAGPCRSKAHGSSSHSQYRLQEAGRAGVRRWATLSGLAAWAATCDPMVGWIRGPLFSFISGQLVRGDEISCSRVYVVPF